MVCMNNIVGTPFFAKPGTNVLARLDGDVPEPPIVINNGDNTFTLKPGGATPILGFNVYSVELQGAAYALILYAWFDATGEIPINGENVPAGYAVTATNSAGESAAVYGF